MNDTASADEMPRKKIAKKVVSTKRRYFFPHHGKSVEAETHEKAIELVNKENNQAKEGDD